MLALVTNDDGIESTGIGVLARAAQDAGLNVLVAAPSWDSSGAGASLTSVERNGRFLTDDRHLLGLDGRCVAVEAAPAFIVRAGIFGAFGAVPDLVLSGVNHGANTGRAVLHSGTVGAALTAAAQAVPAAAFSLAAPTTENWSTVTEVVARVISFLARSHRVGSPATGAVLNVNIPQVEPAAFQGLRRARLAPFGAVTANVTEIDGDAVTIRYEPSVESAPDGSDVALLAQGFATITTLLPLCEHTPGDLPGLDDVSAVELRAGVAR